MKDKLDKFVDITIIIAFLTLIVLRLFGVFQISWWIILCPLWIPFGMGVILALIIFILFLISVVKEKIKK